MPVEIVIDINLNDFNLPIQQAEQRIENNLNKAVDKALSAIEQAQIKSYTATNNPSRPPDSLYERTFTLQSASKTKHDNRKLPSIGGLWYADTGIAKYAKYVLGSRVDQAAIHRGRWKSLEQVESEVQAKIPQILEHIND